VLENGRIIEQGTHEALMSDSTKYRLMVELQTHPPAPPRQRFGTDALGPEGAMRGSH
jgi:hypothetical protein